MRSKKVVTGSKIKMAVAGRSVVSISGSNASTRLAVSKMAARVLRSEFGQGLGGLEIRLTNNRGGHATTWGRRIVVGTGLDMDRTMHTLLHEMAHIKTPGGCWNGCKRGGACDCYHSVAFHIMAFKMFKKFLTKEAAAHARRQEYAYHPKTSQEAAEQMRLGKEHKAWRAARRARAKVAQVEAVEASAEIDPRLIATALEWNRKAYLSNVAAAASPHYPRGCKMQVIKASDLSLTDDGQVSRWFSRGQVVRVQADGRVIGAFGKPISPEWAQQEEAR